MELDHLFAEIAATRLHCEEQEQAINRARLGRAAQDIEKLASEVVPELEQAKAELLSKSISLDLLLGFGPGTRNEPWLEITGQRAGSWPSRAANARGHRVTIRCAGGDLSISTAPPHNRAADSPLDRTDGDEPLTAAAAALLAVEHAVRTLLADAEYKAQPVPTRGVVGPPQSAVAAVFER